MIIDPERSAALAHGTVHGGVSGVESIAAGNDGEDVGEIRT
jgi:hypothetical protein